MEKEIDINNNEQILKECDFNYFYNCASCPFELCMFYIDINNIANKSRARFDVRSAFIYLGRIAITLNKQNARIKELENMNNRLSQGIYWGNGEQFCDVVKKLKQENQQLKQQLKQSQNQKAIEVLEDLKDFNLHCVFGNDIIENYINNQLKELGSEKK